MTISIFSNVVVFLFSYLGCVFRFLFYFGLFFIHFVVVAGLFFFGVKALET